MSAPFTFPSSISFVYWVKIYLIGYMILLSILWHVNTWVICITVPKESSFAIFMLPFCCLNLLKPTQFEKRTCACCSPHGPSLEMSSNAHSFCSLVWFCCSLLWGKSGTDPWSLPHKGRSPVRSVPVKPGSSALLEGDGNPPKKRQLLY